MKIIILLIATVALIAGANATTYAKNPEKIVARVTDKLSLDSNQQDALRVLMDEKKKLRAEMKALRQAKKAQFKVAKENGERSNMRQGIFAELAEKDQISVDDINKIVDTKQAERRERRLPALQAFVDFRNSLSVEQRAQAKPIFRKLLRGVMGHKAGKKHKHS